MNTKGPLLVSGLQRSNNDSELEAHTKGPQDLFFLACSVVFGICRFEY